MMNRTQLDPFDMGMLAGYLLGDMNAREELEERDENSTRQPQYTPPQVEERPYTVCRTFIDSRTQQEKYPKFYDEFHFPPEKMDCYSSEEAEALSQFYDKIESQLTSLKNVAETYKTIRDNAYVHRHPIWDVLRGRKITRTQNNELTALKASFYRQAVEAARMIAIASVHRSQTSQTNKLYRLVMQAEIVDDHRSPLTSPTRLRSTELRRALSKRIRFNKRGFYPGAVTVIPLKIEEQISNRIYYGFAHGKKEFNQALRSRYIASGYTGEIVELSTLVSRASNATKSLFKALEKRIEKFERV